MNQPVHPFLDFDKSTEVGEVPHPAFDNRTHTAALAQGGPRVRQRLLQAERNTPLSSIHIQDPYFHVVTCCYDFGGMLGALTPGHFRDVDEALDTGFKFYEGSVVGDADYASRGAVTRVIGIVCLFPRVRRQLL